MSSEKIRYLRKCTEPYDLDKYLIQVLHFLEDSPTENSQLVEFTKFELGENHLMQYLLIGMFAELTEAEYRELLLAYIAEMKEGEYYISEEGEKRVCDLCSVLLRKADQAISVRDDQKTAIMVASLIIEIIEPERIWVLEEGIYYEYVLDEAREFLLTLG